MGRLYHMGTCVRNMVRGEAENFNAGIVWEYGIPIFSSEQVKCMGKYTDDEIRVMPKITAKIAADYLGISPMMVTLA